jgi:hypothetical protein
MITGEGNCRPRVQYSMQNIFMPVKRNLVCALHFFRVAAKAGYALGYADVPHHGIIITHDV